jgi:hypothetical protein
MSVESGNGHWIGRLFRQVFSIAFAAFIAGSVLGLVAHQDAVRQEFSNARYDCASDLAQLMGSLTSRVSLADTVARDGANAAAEAASDADTAVWWNRTATSCYQLDLLSTSDGDPVGRSFTTAQIASSSAFAPGNNVVNENTQISSGASLVSKSGYWALAALAQVRQARPNDQIIWPFGTHSTPKIADFAFGCPVDDNGVKADPGCTG